MDFIRFSIDNPVKVSVGVLLLILFGILSLLAIPVQLVPDVDRPIITVETNWTGRSPEEVEREIIEEQEDKLKSLSGLRKMKATASQGRGVIELEFFVGVDRDRAFKEVSDKLREVPEYPDDTDEPVIKAADTASDNAIAWMILDSEDPDFDIQSFYHFADERIKPYLERVPGLSAINVYGGRDRQVHIRIDPLKAAQRGITFNQLRAAIQRENVNVSAGDLIEGRLDVRIRTVGQYDNLDWIRQTVVANSDGGPVRIQDLGDVQITLEKRRSFVRANGKPSMALNAIRETGANVIEVMQGLRQRVKEVNEKLLQPYDGGKHGLRLRQVYDETIYIDDAINLVQTNLILGGSLAALVLLLFLRTLRPTLIVSLAIPISVIGTFVAMAGFGRNLNVISLAGLSFAVGMVVDNAIVVLENIDRHLSLGQKPSVAAYRATKEVWGAIVASTLTTLAVFLPVLTIEEEAGQLFRDISLAICAAVTLSLTVSITVIPAAAARWLKPHRTTHNLVSRAVGSLFGIAPLMSLVSQAQANVIHWLIGSGIVRLGLRTLVVALFVIASVGGSVLMMPPASYLPNGNRNLVFGLMLTPPAYNINQALSIAERIENGSPTSMSGMPNPGVRPYWEAKTIDEATRVGPVINMFTQQPYPRVPHIENFFFVSFGGTIFMGCASGDKQLVEPLGPVLSTAMSSIPGAFGFAQQISLFGRGIGGTNTIDVEVSLNDLDRLRQNAQIVYNGLTGAFGFMSVRPDPLNFNLAGPEIQIQPNYIRASELGITMADLGAAISALVDGLIIGDYRLEGQSVDLLLTRHPDFRITPDTLGMVPVAYRDRQGNPGTIPLASIARIVPADAPQQIIRIEEQRSVVFTVTPPQEIPLESAMKQITDLLEQLRNSGQLAPNVETRLAGTADKLVQVRETMLGQWHGWTLQTLISLGTSRIFLALLITYLLMAALFESYLYPFVIMFTVPLATVGGFIGLGIVHLYVPKQQLDLLTMLGFVILIGVVVNNAILLVHQSLNYMRGVAETELETQEAMTPREAIREAVRTRMRPIFMTTLTSVCGMSPLVFMPGSGSELYRGLGAVVLGGLLMATMFTLIVVPLVFSMAIDAKTLAYRLLGWEATELAARGENVSD